MRFAHPQSQLSLYVCHRECLPCWLHRRCRDLLGDDYMSRRHELTQNRSEYDALTRILKYQTVKPTEKSCVMLRRILCLSPDDHRLLTLIILQNRHAAKHTLLSYCWNRQ